LVREALCDSFNTPKVLQELFELMTATNTYIAQSPKEIKVPLVRQVSKFVFHILKCFGIYEDGDFPSVVGSGDGESSASYEETITPLMNVLLKFRDQVKRGATSDGKEILKLCDELRDDILPYLGIQLEDKGKEEDSIWKLENKEVLIAKREAKIADKLKKEEEKRLRKEMELKKKSTSGKDWFRVMESDKYSKFDPETGLPTHDTKDKALSEPIVNKLKKV
jgi:cysteinyl-tRNA synthetase